MKALPEIHKQNIQIRPVFNCINTLNYKVHKIITKILKEKINHKKVPSKNLTRTSEQTKRKKIREEIKIASYTNIKETLEIIKTHLNEDKLEKEYTTQLIKLFQFNYKIYKLK
jgi:hypothetical protein